MADVTELNVSTGKITKRAYTQEDKDSIDATQAEVKKAFDDSDYKTKRLTEYPSISECVHALLDTDHLEALQAKRTAVKEAYPK
tara:strand:- start:1158 stop:1409 length:252 start_codon:yes stop_codon:yes gene_type:complete